MYRSSLIPVVVATVVLAVAACGSDDDRSVPQTTDPAPTLPPVTTPAPPDVDGREFVLTTIDGHELVENSTIRLTFDDGSLSANAGCNTLFGGYAFEDDRLVVDTMGTTEMACEPELMAQDRWLTDVLQLRPVITASDDELVLRGPNGVVLTFTDRVVAEPDLELEGVRWVADSLRTQDAVSTLPGGVEVALAFDDDRVAIEAGCNRGSAEYTVDGDVLTVGPIALTRMMCEPDAMELEAFVTGLLAEPVRYRIEADRLTIDSSDTDTGRGISFVAEPT